MKETNRKILKTLSTGMRLVSVGIILGTGSFCLWAQRIGVLNDDYRIRIAFMIGMPFMILFANIPALILEISDGIEKFNSNRKMNSQNNPLDRTASTRSDQG
jgi:hypothetical protein